jgi:hypothetical protein
MGGWLLAVGCWLLAVAYPIASRFLGYRQPPAASR